MKKIIIISLIVATLFSLGFFLYFNHQKEEKERIGRVIRWSEDYKNAQIDFESGNFDKSFNVYERILKDHPEQDWLRLKIGDMYAETNQYDKALDYYFKVKSPTELSIGHRQIDLRIGGIYEKIGKLDSAIFYYNKILSAESKENTLIGYDNDKVAAYNRLGQIAFNKAQYTDAIDFLTRAIELQRMPKSLYIRANAYYLTNRFDLAQEDYNECIDMIRNIYINKHPYFKNILCDTCGTFFGEEEYMAVLKEWRNFDERIRDRKEVDSLIASRREYKILADSFLKWEYEIELFDSKNDLNSIQRLHALKDSVKKYSDTIMTFNIYE